MSSFLRVGAGLGDLQNPNGNLTVPAPGTPTEGGGFNWSSLLNATVQVATPLVGGIIRNNIPAPIQQNLTQILQPQQAAPAYSTAVQASQFQTGWSTGAKVGIAAAVVAALAVFFGRRRGRR